MFFRLILENANGDRVDMTTTANQYMTAKVDGLNPPPGTISTSGYAGMDGSYLNNTFIEKRNVVIHFEMRGVGLLWDIEYYKCGSFEVYIAANPQNIEIFQTGKIVGRDDD